MGKKVFIIGSVEAADKLNQSDIKNIEIIAQRLENQLVLTNLDQHPERSMKINFQETTGKVTLEFQLQNNQYLAIGDSES